MPKLLDEEDVPIRQVALHALVHDLERDFVDQRGGVLDALVPEWEEFVSACKEQFTSAEATLRFLKEEQEKVQLAGQLHDGTMVQVVCPACSGSGLKPTAVTSGIVQTKSAFETSPQAPHKPRDARDVDPIHRCIDCKGKGWQLMQSYRG